MNRATPTAIILTLALPLGCQPAEPPVETTSVSALAAPGAIDTPTPTAVDADAPTSAPGGDIVKPRYPRSVKLAAEIDAEAVDAFTKRVDGGALPEAARAKLDTVRMPVLLPTLEGLEPSARSYYSAREHGYSASLKPEGHTVYIAGVSTINEYPQIELDAAGDALLKAPYRISRTHQIVTLAFNKFGVGYSIDVECAAPMTDKRCTEDDYAIAIYNSLAMLEKRGGTK